MIIAMITWGYSWTGAKILGPFGDVSSKIFIRFLFASITLIPILLKYRIPFKINKKGFLFILWNSISLCSYNYFYFKSTHMGLAGVGGVLVTTLNPILTSIFVFSFLNKSITMKEMSGLFMGLAGGAIIMRLWEMDLELMIRSGNLFYMLASLSWVSVTISSQKSKHYVHFLAYSFWSFLIAAFFSILFCNAESILYVINYDWVYWVNILLLSVVVMSFANTMYFFASSKIGAVKASSFIFVVPLTAILFSVIILEEEVLNSTIIGGSLSVIAVYLINEK